MDLGLTGRFPTQRQLLAVSRTISQVKIDQGLIGDFHLIGKGVEVLQGGFICRLTEPGRVLSGPSRV